MLADLMQFEFIDLDLRTIAAELEKNTGLNFTLTSLYRIGDPGVHGQLPVRGIDIRCRDKIIGERLAELVNAEWEYDPERPHIQCALAHGKPFHLHLQTHPNTRRR